MAKEILKPNEVKAPTLFVGVGGTGCKIVKQVAEMCKPEERENINFACLDTNVNDLNSVSESEAKIYYIQTSNTQTVGDYLNYDQDALKNWFPKNAVIYDKTVSEGAGQVRAISRLALNATIKTGKILPLYNAIDDLFRKDGKELKQAMRVIIVSTASGGTGSGIMTPLAMFIRDYVTNKYPNTSLIVRSLVMLPETLDSVITSSSERESQRRNAYATIKEINAFMMKGSGFFDVNADLKRYKNLSIDFAIPGTDEKKKLGLLPFDFCFLLDGQNAEDSTMINVGQYIKQAAQALYQQNVGPMQKDAFSMEDNIIKEMSSPGMYGRNRFGGIGAGVLRYPYEDIVHYVAYDWAKNAIGGDGEAAKWSKYDKAFEIQRKEDKKNGLATTDMETLGQVYVKTMKNANDNFSKDMRSAYVNDTPRKLSVYMEALKEEMQQSLLRNGAIALAMDAAKSLASKVNYSNEKNRGKAQANLSKLRAYEMNIKTHAQKTAEAAAEGIFGNEAKTINENNEFTLEMYLKDQDKKTIHPNAMRYRLYVLLEEFEKRAKTARDDLADAMDGLKRFAKTADDANAFDAKYTKGKENTIDALCEAEKGAGEDPTLLEKLGGYDAIYDKINTNFINYHKAITSLADAIVELAAYERGKEQVELLSKMFEEFYNGFAKKVIAIERKQDDLVDILRFQKGDSVKNICATRELLNELCRETLSAGAEGAMLDHELNARIFDAVKANVAFKKEVDASDVVEEDRSVDIFDDILLGYFIDSVRNNCKTLDMNIVEAMGRENVLLARAKSMKENSAEKTFKKVENEDNIRHIHKVMAMGCRLAAPGIQRLRSEESRELVLCAYNKCLNDMRNYRMETLIPKGTSASAVDTVSRYEMHFFNALYNLTPDKLDKFAAPSASETRKKNAGLYHNAYVNYSRKIGPDSTKGAILSTHIDKRWDNIAVMPELDFAFQEKQIMRIHQALIYGLIYKAISYQNLSKAAGKKKVYKYENSEERYVDLTVSNGTLCDEFYEILDSLYVSSYIVEDILDKLCAKNRDRDLNRNSNYADTEFAGAMKEFKLDCMHDGATSLFEIPLAYYNTLPNSQRFVSELSSLVDAVIKTLRDELTIWESDDDVKFMLCDILVEQFKLLMANYKQHKILNKGVKANENPVLDIIFRKVRKVVETTPEPEDYEDKVLEMRALIQK